jgi:hypothetical protein
MTCCISVKYCPDDGLYRPKHVGNIVNTSHLINIVHLFVLRHCSLMYKTHIKKVRSKMLLMQLVIAGKEIRTEAVH